METWPLSALSSLIGVDYGGIFDQHIVREEVSMLRRNTVALQSLLIPPKRSGAKPSGHTRRSAEARAQIAAKRGTATLTPKRNSLQVGRYRSHRRVCLVNHRRQQHPRACSLASRDAEDDDGGGRRHPAGGRHLLTSGCHRRSLQDAAVRAPGWVRCSGGGE